MSVNDVSNNTEFFGLIILKVTDSNSYFLYIFKSMWDFYGKWLAAHSSMPPAEDSVRVYSKE